jgi:preprotein translocase SecE subunit
VAIQIYKAGQGRYTRIGTAVGAAVVILILAYYTMVVFDRHLPTMTQAQPTAQEGAQEQVSWIAPYRDYVRYGVPALLGAGLAVLTAVFLNKPNFVDFLIATESEMKKVSWSSRAELLGSTTVVIVTVFVLAFVIWLVDTLFIFSMTRVLNLW